MFGIKIFLLTGYYILHKYLSHLHTRMEATIRYTFNVMLSGLLFLVLLLQSSQGSKSECKETDCLHTVVTFVVIMEIIIIILVIIKKRRFIVKSIFQLTTRNNNRRYENDKVPDSEDQRHDMVEIHHSVHEMSGKFKITALGVTVPK